MQELAQYPFLMREKGSSVRTILEAYFALHHITVHPAWESVSTQTIIKAVAEGLGVAVLPKMLCKRDADEGAVTMLPFDEPLRRTLHIICHRSKYLSVSMQRFVELCQSTEYAAR